MKSFADYVEAATVSRSSNIGHVVQALNALPKKLRADAVAYIENPPPGKHKTAIMAGLSQLAKDHGHECKLTTQHLKTFLDGDRYGLDA